MCYMIVIKSVINGGTAVNIWTSVGLPDQPTERRARSSSQLPTSADTKIKGRTNCVRIQT